MFNRKNYKKQAKTQLKNRYTIPALVQFIVLVLISIFVRLCTIFFKPEYTSSISHNRMNFSFNIKDPKSILYFVVTVCIMSALTLAQKSMYNRMYGSIRKMTFSDFIAGLDQWWQAFRGGLWNALWVHLWSLLFVIPGIVKAYSYSMMFYIMAEYPKIGVMKAMKLSKEMTRGYKSELFALDLSFLGWFILGILFWGLPLIWILPYYTLTKTNAYHALKETAINIHLLTEADFN